MPTDYANLSPGVSIVIVSAHESHRLLSTLRSIPNDVRNLEIILITPKSDNEARDIVRKASTQEIRVFNDLGLGVYPAMNIGLSHARYTHVLFLNTGDLIIGSYQLNYCISEIEKEPFRSYILPIEASWSIDLTACRPNLGSFISGDRDSYVSHQGVLFLKSFVTQEGRFDERFKIAADFKQLCSLYYTKNYSIIDLRLVSIEYPKFSSTFNRRGRVESIVVSICHLQGLLRIRAIIIRLRGELRDLL